MFDYYDRLQQRYPSSHTCFIFFLSFFFLRFVWQIQSKASKGQTRKLNHSLRQKIKHILIILTFSLIFLNEESEIERVARKTLLLLLKLSKRKGNFTFQRPPQFSALQEPNYSSTIRTWEINSNTTTMKHVSRKIPLLGQ